MRVLVVGDEVKMGSLLRRGLIEEGHAAGVARTGDDALWLAAAVEYDAIVLDVMLPGRDGFDVCRELRERGVWAPVLMLTARTAVEDRISGLDAGADDYLPKPFAFGDLYLSVRATLDEQIAEHPATRVDTIGDRDEVLASLLALMLLVGPLALLLAAFAGYRLAGAALRPESMRREAAAISSETSGRRLPIPEPRDEVRRLGETLNEMLERLDEGLLRERRFVADAGHELRTPLALLRTELELALRAPRSQEELEEALRSAIEEVERLIRLAERLLVLERSGEAELRRDELDARELLDAVARRFGSSAAAVGRAIETHGGGRSAATATGSSRRSAASSTTRSRRAAGPCASKPSPWTTRSCSASPTRATASRRTSCRVLSSASAAPTRRGRAAAPALGSRSSTPSRAHGDRAAAAGATVTLVLPAHRAFMDPH